MVQYAMQRMQALKHWSLVFEEYYYVLHADTSISRLLVRNLPKQNWLFERILGFCMCVCVSSCIISLFPVSLIPSCLQLSFLMFTTSLITYCVYILSQFSIIWWSLMIPRDKTPIDGGLISRCTLTASWATTTGTGVCDLFSDTRASFSL